MSQNTNDLPKKERVTLRQGRSWFGLIALAATLIIALIIQVRQWILSVMATPKAVSPTVSVLDIADSIVLRVRGHMTVPSEVPFVERIQDITTARAINPTFYEGLEQGDWILRYPSIIIVYRATGDRIIRVREVAQPASVQR